MKKTNLLKKAVCAATATVLCVAPLLACGDKDNFQGVKVTEQQWNERVEAYYNCQNFTETIKFYMDDDCYEYRTMKFDIASAGVVYGETVNADILRDSLYIFTTPLEQYDDPTYIAVYRDWDQDSQWKTQFYTGTNSRFRLDSIKFYPDSYSYSILAFLDAYDDYANYTYNNDGYYEKHVSKEVYGGTITNDYKVYFSEEYLYACYMKSGGSLFSESEATSECTDYGTTVVKVPAEVQAIADKYLTPNAPDAE